MAKNISITAYHGTNRNFINHDASKSRTELNNKYQGDWICYTQNKEVAFKYAEAARNQCFDKALFTRDMQNYFSDKGIAGMYYLNLSLIAIENGSEVAFDTMVESYASDHKIDKNEAYPAFMQMLNQFNSDHGLEVNEWFDLLEHVEGSKIYLNKDDDNIQDIMNIFNQQVSEIDHYALELHDKLEFKYSKLQPQAIVSTITGNNVLYTDDREQARNAKDNGYDTVFYSGVDCVDGETEILVSSAKQIEILHKILKMEEREYTVDGYISHIEYKKTDINGVEIKDNLPKLNNDNKKERPKASL